MEQLVSWASSWATVVWGWLGWVLNYWSLPTILLLVPVLVVILIVAGPFLHSPR
jgi:hypothetical protein